VSGERPLGLHHGMDGIRSVREGNEEGIALGAHYAAMVRFARLAQKLLMLREQGREFLPQLL
jgi:hypothetical protein